MSDHVPTTAEVQGQYMLSVHRINPALSASDVSADFNRWLNEVRAEAIRETAEAFATGEGLEVFAVANVTDDVSAVRATSKWLDERADKIEIGE